jgi:hypothetical protein
VFTDRTAVRTTAYGSRRSPALRSAGRWRCTSLYHVPGITAAVRELRGVVKPRGVLVVTTNGADDKREIGQLFADSVHDLTGAAIDPPDPDGPSIPADAGPLRAMTGALMPAEVPWEAFLGAVRGGVATEIERHGVWRLGNQVGVLTCR